MKHSYGHFLMFHQGYRIYLPGKEKLLDSLHNVRLIAVKGNKVIEAKGGESIRVKIQLERE